MSNAAKTGVGDFRMHAVRVAASLSVFSMLTVSIPACAGSTDIEVFHYLATRADAQRVTVLQDALQSAGYNWKDFTVTQGWTGRGESLLRFRVQSRNAPAAAMMKTPLMHQWAASGALLPLDRVAAAGRWDDLLPKAVADLMKYKGHYYAVPLTIHRVNWLWINERILKESGAAVPATWDEFFVTAEAMKRKGYAAVAYYGRDTQNLLLFETIAVGIGGAAFHHKALVEYDATALTSPVMERVLGTYRRIKGYTEQPSDTRISMERSSKFETGTVGMHLMGDWANPAFYPADKAAPFRSLCVAAPGSDGSFLFASDSIAMFRHVDAATSGGQHAFAAAIMSPLAQRGYNVRKGSIPPRQDASLNGFHSCALKSASAFRAASIAHTLLPAISMTASREVEDGIQDVVTEFWNNDRMSVQAAMGRLVAATRRR